ncbi:hypothetical protein AMS68_007748 [Peltaster fructicola]|uniref:Hcy-binding domain-containing protein n=1 Tax=Peltaster fructicola TaxID=286661 RepID=A0A6H0Y5M5_9PEZI|nr:hypothetical protein AMS68_007748 [Peltaster fructicola]
MLTKAAFHDLLNSRGTLIIDGALATELESRGHDLTHPLWSGRVLHQDPADIKAIHLQYFLAGSDIAITSTYQTSIPGLKEQLNLSGAAAKSLIVSSVRIAQSAREAAYTRGVPADRTLIVAGSVGPYGAYLADGSEYRGDYNVPSADMKAFHRGRIQALVEAGADVLCLETMPNLEEVRALLELLTEEFPTAIMVLSCTLKDATHISDGSSIPELLVMLKQLSTQIVGFGVNCVPPDLITDFLNSARALTDIPLLCYPNSGEVYDGASNTWSGTATHQDLASRTVEEWIPAGVRLVGGCCRTTPEDIRNLVSALHTSMK